MSKPVFALLTEQGQARARHGNVAPLVEEVVLAIAQAPLGRIVEAEIGIMLFVMTVADDLDLWPLQSLDDGTFVRDLDLDLHLERLLFHRAAQGDQLGEN